MATVTPVRRGISSLLVLVAAGAAAAAGLLVAYRASPTTAFVALVAVVTLPSLAYVTWHVHPAVLLSGGIALSVFSGNWGNLGLPELIAPDRLLIAAAIATVILRAPQVAGRGPIEMRPVHWLLAATIAYLVASALAAGTLFDKESLLRLTDRVGAAPFLLFLLSPVIFSSPRQRSMLLACLVAAGLYLSVTALFEITGARALIFPRYISDPSLGIHFGRARGPFLEAVGNGTAIYIGLVAAVIAAATWRARWQRNVAVLTAALCVPALLFTLTRSIWIGALLASVVTMLSHRAMRRWLLVAAISAALVTTTAVAVIPGLSEEVHARQSQQGPIWDRLNLSRAALNMVSARPLVGFGWDRFRDVGTDYFQLGDYPLTAGVGTVVHSAYLSHLAELGLLGTSLWLASALLSIWLALSRRGPPELEPWRYGLLAISAMFFVVSAFAYPYLFATVVLWTWAGIVYGAAPTAARTAEAPARM
jgi:putative inorganic carbon (hco3(-)) transporter